MELGACVIITGFAIFLFGLSAAVYAKPESARRFLRGFASSGRTHYAEQAVRLLLGLALIVRSPEMWRSGLFWTIGWLLVISATALLILPWRWHQQLGIRVIPVVVRHLRWYGVGMLVFGTLLLYGLYAPLVFSTH